MLNTAPARFYRLHYHKILAGLTFAGLYLVSRSNYLLFHSLAELFSIVIAFTAAMLAWNSARYLGNGYLLFIGGASLVIGIVDLLHTLAYKGMGVFPGNDANLATQLWVAARSVHSLAFVLAPLFILRRRAVFPALIGLAGLAALLLAAIFWWQNFPVAFVQGAGLTHFKILSEYGIIVAFAIAGGLLWRGRAHFDAQVARHLLWSIVWGAATELVATVYTDVYGLSNTALHFFKILAFYHLYKAIIESGFIRPYNTIFLNLKKSETALIQSRDELEDQVAQRTQALEAQRAMLESVLTQAADGILVVGSDLKISFANHAARRFTGRPDAPETAYTLADFGVPHSGSQPISTDQRPVYMALRGEKVTAREMHMHHPDGREFDLLISATPLRGQDGAVISAVVSYTDITEKRRAEEELRQAYAGLEARVAERTAELERSNRELQDFAYVASHDLQEPLRKITAFGNRIYDLAGERLGEESSDYLKRMLRAADRMREMVNALLSLSRVTTRAQPFTPVDLNEVARDVVSDLEMRIERSGGRVTLEPLPTVEADPMQMRQLLQNLLSNALKFCRPGVPPVVRAYTQPDPGGAGCVMVLVEDNGIGFEGQYTERLFQPFQRLHGMGEYEGSGMGLAICQKIVLRHGGQITAHSQPGQGSIFAVTLPIEQSSR